LPQLESLGDFLLPQVQLSSLPLRLASYWSKEHRHQPAQITTCWHSHCRNHRNHRNQKMIPLGQCYDNSHFSSFQHIGPPPAVVPVRLKNGSSPYSSYSSYSRAYRFQTSGIHGILYIYYYILLLYKAHVKIHKEKEGLLGRFDPPR
jgi:hypothetical protein